jgi:Chitobiase/beta-hexosaminidase C-terminal domain/Regulator of chromosome condensation (RCC1) repeat
MKMVNSATEAQSTANVPVVVNGVNAVAVMAGLFHSGALLSNGTIRTWGKNDAGQLGDRTNVNRPSPVEVGASFGVVTPDLNPDGGNFNSTIGVSTFSTTQGCIIYYTTDGSEPTKNDPALSNGSTIVVSRSLTLKVKAFKPGWPASQTKIASFELPASSPTPTPTPIPGGSDRTSGCRRGGIQQSVRGNSVLRVSATYTGGIGLSKLVELSERQPDRLPCDG